MAGTNDLSFDPTEFGSAEEFARSRADMDAEFGMPTKPYTGEVGRLVNQQHFEREAARRDEFGWHGSTRADLRKQWDL